MGRTALGLERRVRAGRAAEQLGPRAFDFKLVVFAAGVPVWRRVRVDGAMTLRCFNRLVWRAFEWPLSHEYVLGL